MNPTSTTTIDDVKSVLAATLDLPADRAKALDASTPLLGNLPELDSMAVLEVLSAIEARFGVDQDEVVSGAKISEDVREVIETHELGRLGCWR